ncbi:MAG: type I restriction endonuclease subunit R, partial [Epsilonproteobacteria bacterium]
NPRGAHDDEEEKDPLDLIIKSFNEKWFQGWDATPEEQRVRFINLAKKIKEHPDYQSKYVDNPDTQNRDLAYTKIFDDVMNQQRRSELELYKLISQDDAFRQAMQDTIKRILY